MTVISKTNDYGLTAGKEYEVIEESCGFFKVFLDNGNLSFRSGYLFTVKSGEGKRK